MSLPFDQDGFWWQVFHSKGTHILLLSTLLSSVAIGCVAGVVPATLSDRYAHMDPTLDFFQSCSSFNHQNKPIPCQHGSDKALNAAALANVGLCILSLAFNPYIGKLSDKKGRKGAITLGLLLNAVPALVFYIIVRDPRWHPVWYYVSFSLIGVVNYLSMAFAMLSDIFEEDRVAAAYGLLMAVYSGGLALGASLPVVLRHHHIALASLILSIGAVVVAAWLLPESHPPTNPSNASPLGSSSYALSILVRTRSLQLLTAASFMSGLVFASDATLLIYYLQDQLDVNDADLSRLFLCLGLMGILVQGVLLQPLQTCLGRHGLLVTSFVCGSLHNLLYGLATSKLTIFVAFGLCQFTHLSLPLLSSEASQLVLSHERGRLQAALGTVSSVAFCVGPLSTWWVYTCTKDVLFPGFMFVYCSGLFVIGGILVTLVPRESLEASSSFLQEPLLVPGTTENNDETDIEQMKSDGDEDGNICVFGYRLPVISQAVEHNEPTMKTTERPPSVAHNLAKNLSLLALVFQQVGLVLFIRYSKTRSDAKPYLTSTAVVTAEVAKLLLNMTLEICSNSGKVYQILDIRNAVPLLIPALAYVIQNNLLFVALANLSVPVYQVTNQGKLLTTALCSRILLQKELSYRQYFALLVLALGVALVQLSGVEHASSNGSQQDQNQMVGLVAVIVSCFTSGFAGVYFEKMLKSTQHVSVYMRNSQLALWSIALGMIPVLSWDSPKIYEQGGFFVGYNAIVWIVIMCQALTGLLVGLVMKYADTILKGFATSVAVVLATLLSMVIWNTQVDYLFVTGATMVMVAVRLYTRPEWTVQDAIPARKPFVLAMMVCILFYTITSSQIFNAKPLPLFHKLSLPGEQDNWLSSHGQCEGSGQGTKVRYARKPPLLRRPKCSPLLKVLDFVTYEVRKRNQTLLVAYGDLIHILRDKDIVRADGTHMDDDIDMWISYDTFHVIFDLEKELWERFGWTMRVVMDCHEKYTVFAQLMSPCDYAFTEVVQISTHAKPIIDLLPLQMQENGNIAHDLWQGTSFPTKLLFPGREVPLESKGYHKALHVDVPQHAEKILSCIYGNWTTPSSKRASAGNSHQACLNEVAKIL